MDQTTEKEKTEGLAAKKKELLDAIESIPSDKAMKTEIMELLHKYNEIKDAAQTVIGALANIKQVTFKRIHEELKVPFD